MKSGFALYRSTRIHYTEWGRGRALLLLHGFLGNRQMWNDFALKLSQRYRVVAIDLLGHGESECVGYVHTMEEMAQATEAVCRKLRIRRASLVGHSMGGYVALAFADLYPDRISRLCLFFSHAAADSAERKKSRRAAAKLVVQNPNSFVRKTLPRLFRYTFRKNYPELVHQALLIALDTPPRGIVAALEGMALRPSREIILKFPPYSLYYIAGRFDPVLPISEARRQMQLGEKIKGFVLHQAGHMGHLEEPARCLDLLEEFMQS